MTNRDVLKRAKELYTSNFNNLPYEIRKSIASPIDRLSENAMAIKMAEKHLQDLKRRRRELEDWLLRWYKENNLEE